MYEIIINIQTLECLNKKEIGVKTWDLQNWNDEIEEIEVYKSIKVGKWILKKAQIIIISISQL